MPKPDNTSPKARCSHASKPNRRFSSWLNGTTINGRLATELSMHNPQPLHVDADFAAKSEFGRILVNGTFTFSLMVGLSVADTTMGTLIANLGYDKLIMPRPVHLGDTLHAVTEVVEVRGSKSRPEAGIVTFRHELLNQHARV